MSFLSKFVKNKQDEIKGKEKMTAGQARIEILQAAMINETAHLAKGGVNLDTISNEDLKALIKESFRKKQEAGELQFPLYDWYCDVFEPKQPAQPTENT